jgi:hypothetical protein
MHEIINKVPQRIKLLSLIPKRAAAAMAKEGYRKKVLGRVPKVVKVFIASEFHIPSEADGLLYAYYKKELVRSKLIRLLCHKKRRNDKLESMVALQNVVQEINSSLEESYL